MCHNVTYVFDKYKVAKQYDHLNDKRWSRVVAGVR